MVSRGVGCTVDGICELLETYSGRDKIVRLSCYVLKLWGSLSKNEGLLKASSRLSGTRVTMRLFDDLPMLRYTLEYGLGKEEPEKFSSFLGLLNNAVDQLFFPIEKICWLNEVGILKLSKEKETAFDTTNTVFWVVSLYLTLIRGFRQLRLTEKHRVCISQVMDNDKVHRNLQAKHVIETITCIKLCMDLTHAINCLPKGWLWGEKLNGVKVGALATISSLIGIGLHFAKKRLKN